LGNKESVKATIQENGQMETKEKTDGAAKKVEMAWGKIILIALIFEKIIQHIFVTIAFALNWGDIGSTVAVNPGILMILGAIVAVLFILCLWGMITQQQWAINLVIALAIFDIVGEFVAQGRMDIMLNVSFLVACILLALAIVIRRQKQKRMVRRTM
jgi:hypothetical protein